MPVTQVLVYICVAIFLVAVVAKVLRYARSPLSMRWELYPVAHERDRHSYGGSAFEELDWWEQPRKVDRINEMKEMFMEIVLLKGVRLNNRRLWVFSFPFHLGLYLVVGWLLLLLVAAFLPIPTILLAIVGYPGLALTALGALGLMIRRIGNPEMRRFNSPAEYLNLLFILVSVGGALGISLAVDSRFDQLGVFVSELIRFRPASVIGTALATEIILGALLIAYIPLTRMSHFVAKYFLYHHVRWADEACPRGSKIEARIKQALDFGVSWEGPHIQTGKSWGEVVTEAKE